MAGPAGAERRQRSNCRVSAERVVSDLVYAAGPQHVRSVVIHGETVYEDGAFIRADGRRVILDAVRLADARTQLHLYAILRGWLALHIGATVVLLTLLFAHIGAVVLWFR